MATRDAERICDEWANAWSSHDPDAVVALFTEDCVYEDVTFELVFRGKEELRNFARGAFAAVPDFRFQLTSRLATARGTRLVS